MSAPVHDAMTVTVTSPCPRLFCRGHVVFGVDALTGIVSGACPACATLYELRHGRVAEVASISGTADQPTDEARHPSPH